MLNRLRRFSVLGGVVATLGCSSIANAQSLPSFPGAEGFGAVATGGRGGQVIKVTTLASTGPGSLQAALDTPGPRIIVFDVSGVIPGDHVVNHGDVTIAGQTAPGAGITIAGRLSGKYDDAVTNIIVRHIRVRPTHAGEPGHQFDAVQFSRNSQLMFDHVSASWGVDETFDVYEADDVTVQYSTITESATSGHPEGQHNYGLISGPDGHRISLHHNLFAHHKNRAPAIANGPAEVTNNLIYNVRHGFVHHNPANGQFNITGNVYVQGPNDALYPFWFDDETPGSDPALAYHLADNFIDDPGDYVGVVHDPWTEASLHPSFASLFAPATLFSPAPHDFTTIVPTLHPVSKESSSQTSATVLAEAGAFPRDVVTTRILGEVQSRNGSWGVDAPSSLTTGLTPVAPATDLDDDGMADAWETAHELNPGDGTDHDTLMPSGYTAIETYINELADTLVYGPGGSSSNGTGGGAAEGGSGGGGLGEGGFADGGGGSGEEPEVGPGDNPLDDYACSVGSSSPARGIGALALVALALVLGTRRPTRESS